MTEAKHTLWRIEAPHFVAGLIVNSAGRIRESAPILGWSIGKDWLFVKKWMKKKGWHGAPIKA